QQGNRRVSLDKDPWGVTARHLPTLSDVSLGSKLFALGVLVAMTGASTAAEAYPSSVIFAPVGDARELGNMEAFAYTGMLLAPKTHTDASWVGLQSGLLPRIMFGKSGI